MSQTTLRGQLLVAHPALRDPNFERTVVLVLEHGDDGAIGVVLNRPSDFGVDGALPSWAGLAALPSVVFIGGPVVDEGTAVCLARARAGAPANVFKPVLEDLGTLDVSHPPEELGATIEEVRLYAGYAGWSAGQLEAEIEAGGWFVVDARPVDGFTSDPGGLWQAVLARQSGETAWFATFPPDIAMN